VNKKTLYIGCYIVCAAITSGCTSLNFGEMLQPAQNVRAAERRHDLLGCKTGFAQALTVDQTKFVYVLPAAAIAEDRKTTVKQLRQPHLLNGFSVNQPMTAVTKFDDFRAAVEAGANARVPASVRDNRVYKVLLAAMIKSVADAQTSLGVAAGADGASREAGAVQAYAPDLSVSATDLKQFAMVAARAQLRPALSDPKKDTDPKKDNVFASYFSTYYDGKFVDRFGQTIAKPSLKLPDLNGSHGVDLSITVSDADIAGALTILVDYLADLVDTTPVFGVGRAADGSGATYYPGDNAAVPTALVTNMTPYMDVSAKCGVNKSNVKVLGYVAKGAGDAAQLGNGLIAQSAGGFGVSLGVFGKISVGDNQTLGTVVKTVSSRAAMRIALASGYAALERYSASADADAQRDGSASGAVMAPAEANPSEYLDFSL
jgi:hypothetical protein